MVASAAAAGGKANGPGPPSAVVARAAAGDDETAWEIKAIAAGDAAVVVAAAAAAAAVDAPDGLTPVLMILGDPAEAVAPLLGGLDLAAAAATGVCAIGTKATERLLLTGVAPRGNAGKATAADFLAGGGGAISSAAAGAERFLESPS